MTTLDLKLQRRADNKGLVIVPKRRPSYRTSRPTQFSNMVRGNRQLKNRQAWDEINNDLFV